MEGVGGQHKHIQCRGFTRTRMLQNKRREGHCIPLIAVATPPVNFPHAHTLAWLHAVLQLVQNICPLLLSIMLTLTSSSSDSLYFLRGCALSAFFVIHPFSSFHGAHTSSYARPSPTFLNVQCTTFAIAAKGDVWCSSGQRLSLRRYKRDTSAVRSKTLPSLQVRVRPNAARSGHKSRPNVLP